MEFVDVAFREACDRTVPRFEDLVENGHSSMALGKGTLHHAAFEAIKALGATEPVHCIELADQGRDALKEIGLGFLTEGIEIIDWRTLWGQPDSASTVLQWQYLLAHVIALVVLSQYPYLAEQHPGFIRDELLREVFPAGV